MGPDRPGVSSSDEHVVARLLGDLAPYSGDMPDIGATKYLMVPLQPASHPRVLEGVEAWMLVDKSAVTLDGLTCNKIGVSYTAFRNQANKCNAVAGSCLPINSTTCTWRMRHVSQEVSCPYIECQRLRRSRRMWMLPVRSTLLLQSRPHVTRSSRSRWLRMTSSLWWPNQLD